MMALSRKFLQLGALNQSCSLTADLGAGRAFVYS